MSIKHGLRTLGESSEPVNIEVSQQISGVRQWYNLIAANFTHRYDGLDGIFWKCFEEDLALELLGGVKTRILDMGCGSGRLATSLGRLAYEVVGIDISEEMIALARNRPHSANVQYEVMDATRTSFQSGYFDAVISLGMFEYLEDPTPFLQEIGRVLRPGGRLVFTCHSTGGQGFYRWWTLPGRIQTKFRNVIRPTYSDSASSLYFGYPRSLWERLCPKAKHPLPFVQHCLRSQGFERIDYRGFLYPPSTSLFYSAACVPIRSFSAAGMNAAWRLDRWLGKVRTRANATVVMFAAWKSS